jgi:hypothetical protein
LRGCFKPFWIVTEETKSTIAQITQEAAHDSRHMVMVNMTLIHTTTRINCTTNATSASLCLQERRKISKS